MTPQQVAEGLSERDLAMLMMYANRHMLPTRRLQMQIARLCQITANNGKPLGSFLFDYSPPGAVSEAETVGQELAAIAGGGGVYVLGRKRKAREAARRVH